MQSHGASDCRHEHGSNAPALQCPAAAAVSSPRSACNPGRREAVDAGEQRRSRSGNGHTWPAVACGGSGGVGTVSGFAGCDSATRHCPSPEASMSLRISFASKSPAQHSGKDRIEPSQRRSQAPHLLCINVACASTQAALSAELRCRWVYSESGFHPHCTSKCADAALRRPRWRWPCTQDGCYKQN